MLLFLRSTVGIVDIAVIGDVPLDTENLLGDWLVSWLGGLSIIFDFRGIGCFIFISCSKGYFFAISGAGLCSTNSKYGFRCFDFCASGIDNEELSLDE